MTNVAILTDQTTLVGLRSRKHILPFSLVRPTTVAEACTTMRAGGRAAFMAGGLDLIDRMKNGEAFDRVIFLDDITPLHGIQRVDGRIVIGALATHADVGRSDVLASAVPGLSALWREIANPRVRHTGTLGGNLMAGLPHYDAAPALLALGAEATLSTSASSRTISIDALADHRGALLESVAFRAAPALHLLADRSLHPTLSVYLGASSANGVLIAARIGVGCAYARALAVDLPVDGKPLPRIADNAADLACAVIGGLPPPMDDGLASGSYRSRVMEVLIRRLLVRLGATA
jgi:aerobic carbon-monoxide dehydrogenase medium subunit